MIEKSLCEISNPKQWKTISTDMLKDEGYPVYGANGIIGYYSEYNHEEKTLLITCRGATCGSLNICDPYSYVNGNAMALDNLIEEINIHYLYYYLLNRGLNDAITGTAQPQIVRQSLQKVVIKYPELEVQHQIVNRLNQVANLINKRKKQLEKLDGLVKSRFVELFGNPISNPMKWDIYQLEECLERIDNGKSFICSDKPRNGDNPAILKLSAATYGDYRPNENKALLDESLFVESSEVHAGDLLFTRKNTPELVGTAAYVQNTPPKLMMPDLIFRLVPNEKVNAVFLWQLINCKEFRPVIQAISGGSAKSMSNISKERLGKIKVICPPRELQDSLIPFVKRVDKSKFEIKQSLEKLELLKKVLMQKYFG